MAMITSIMRRGPILGQLSRRACIRFGVLQFLLLSRFFFAIRMLLAVLDFETSSVCIELVLFGMVRGDREMALSLFSFNSCMLGPDHFSFSIPS